MMRRSGSVMQISNARFWLYTISLLLLWTIVIASNVVAATTPPAVTTTTVATVTHPPPQDAAAPRQQNKLDKEEQKNARNCKALCEHCGCMGFYCGEECICEYNSKKENSDIECIAVMQSNARKLKIPFEILIQGPSSNRFVRNALQFEQNVERRQLNAATPLSSLAEKEREKVDSMHRNKRSTVVIYKPATQNSLYDTQLGNEQKPAMASGGKQTVANDGGTNLRHKRSVSQLEWFSDLANTLVRPAPLGGVKRIKPSSIEDYGGGTVHNKRSADELDRSWFTDTTSMLIRPSPLFRRQSSTSSDPDEMPLNPSAITAPMGKVIKDTIRSIQGGDLGETLRTKVKDGVDVLQDTFQRNNLDFFPKDIRDHFVGPFQNMKMFRSDMEVPKAPPPTPMPAPAPKFAMPWFRPVRFLQRVRQAIN